jgi:hypothetical protein
MAAGDRRGRVATAGDLERGLGGEDKGVGNKREKNMAYSFFVIKTRW